MPDPRRIDQAEVQAAIDRLVQGISERHAPADPVLLLGIANGGVELARRLGQRLPHCRVGTLDISFHRDDIGRNPIPKEFAPTEIPGDVNGSTVILVDDVLFSGRTVKAALDELFDHGRPSRVELAILVDRGGRRLPFAADYCGIKIETTAREKVVVNLHRDDANADEVLVRAAP